MEDKILIVDHTIEEITVEETTSVPTGTIITSTHGMDRGDQHTIRDIVGLTTKLDNIEKLHQVRSDLGGHADYYLWGEEATADNPLGPGYFVRLGEDGKIHKCTNETVILRPTDLTLDKDEQGQVIIYALAGNGNIATADINKYYVVGTRAPYDIYGYDGVEYVKKSAYSYDGEKVVKTCHTTDALGVTVSSAGFVGNDENITETYTSAKAADPSRYALVATTGVVDVLCDHSILVGDYVYPTVSGWAAKSTGSYGYLVTALVQNGIVVQTVDAEELLYARIVLSQSMVNAKKISDNVDYLLAETQRIGENVIEAVNNAQTALDEIRDSGGNLSDRVSSFESSMNAMGEQLYTNTVAVDNANATAANAELIARQADEFVKEVASSATGGASEALAIAKTLEEEMVALSQGMESYTSKIGVIENEQNTQAYMISKAKDDIAIVQTRATTIENSVTSLANKETELRSTMALIDQRANEQGSSITALTSKIDKYSVGEYSQAYGLTQAQAADILDADKIVFIPTDFISDDARFTEHYNPTVLESWDATGKNVKYIYEVGGNYYYHNGAQWTSDTISNMQLAGYCVTNFTEGYSYVWSGQKWMPETASHNVFFTDDTPTGMASVNPLYWVVGAGYEGADYKVGALYLYKNSVWSEVALGSSNSMSRVSALVKQTQNSWQSAINTVKGDMAALSAQVDENGSNVAMVASVVKEVEGVSLDFADNTEKIPYTSINDIISEDRTKYFVVGTKVPYDIYYYNGTTYIQKINWSYDGQRVLQPNTASIVTSANEDGSGIKLSADHINFESGTYTVKAKHIDFRGSDYKINADRIDLNGSATFSNYAKLENVITDTTYRYCTSTSNIELVNASEWSTTYPVRASNEYIWRETKITKGNGGAITTSECITPADGRDGTSVNIKGMADEQPTNIGGGLYTIKFNGATITDGELGDGYMYGEPADLYVCVVVNTGEGEADHFQNVGQIQGPQGASGASLEIKYLNSSTRPTITGNNVDDWDNEITPPDDGKSTYMTQRVGATGTWSAPIQISGIDGEPGADGESIKFIYYRSIDKITSWDGIFNSDNMFNEEGKLRSSVWQESPQGVDTINKYEYVSMSTTYEICEVDDGENVIPVKAWNGFSNPVVWSKYGEKGQDGDGVEYWYYLSNSSDAPTISNFDAATGDFTKTGWSDEPSSTSLDNCYEYVVQIKKTTTDGTTTYTQSAVTLWAVYDGLLARYVTGVELPKAPTGTGETEAYTGSNWSATPPTEIDTGESLWVSYKTVLGTTWGMPIKTSATDGLNGVGIKKIETYYLVTDIKNPSIGAGGASAPSVPVNPFIDVDGTQITPSWSKLVEHWGVKVDEDHRRTTQSENVKHIYQYLWVCEKMIMDDATETVRWGDPRLDASMATMGNWCAANDKTLINGGNIATGSITAAQMATDAIRSQDYNGELNDDGTIKTYGTVGTMLNLKDGILDSNNIRITGHVVATSGQIGDCTIDEEGHLKAPSLSSLSANLGEVTAGSISSPDYDISGVIDIWNASQVKESVGLLYEDNGDSYTVIGIGDWTGANLVIPAAYNGKTVTSIAENAFANCDNLKSVIIGKSVTSIGKGAFSGCSSLTEIILPFVGAKAGKTSSDTYQYPFGYIFGTSSYTGGVSTTQYYYGDNLNMNTYTTYVIPSLLEKVTITGGNILRGAFQNCENLITIEIPDSVTSIGLAAFSKCSSLTSIEIPDGVTSIDSSAFYRCSSLTSIEIPDSVTSIGERAFYECGSLSSVTIGNSVTSIGYSAFYDCDSLTSVVIPDSVTSIGPYAFSGCSSLTIYCEAESQPSGWNKSWNVSNRPVYYYRESQPIEEGNYWHYTRKGFKISCDDEYMINSPYFKVTQDGEIKAVNANLEGRIKAKTGYIGNLYINERGDLSSNNFQIYNEINGNEAYSMLRLNNGAGEWSTTLSPTQLSVPSVYCTELSATSGYIGQLTTDTLKFDTVTRGVNGQRVDAGRIVFGNSQNNVAIEFVSGVIEQISIDAEAEPVYDQNYGGLGNNAIKVALFKSYSNPFEPYYAERAISVVVKGYAMADGEEFTGTVVIQPGTSWGCYCPGFNFGVRDSVYVMSMDGVNNFYTNSSAMRSSSIYPLTTDATIRLTKTIDGVITTSQTLI